MAPVFSLRRLRCCAELFINMENFPAKQIMVDKLGMNS
jgi:hypothetical protein